MSAELDEQAVERLHDLIAREAAVLGPRADGGDDEDHDEDTAHEDRNHMALEEWVLVMSWTDLETGESHVTRHWSKQMPFHHRTGLLHEALYW
jgi:hypothetical protein